MDTSIPPMYESAPIFSDKDEQEELEELSDDEKEEILNDIHGRKVDNSHNNNNNSNTDNNDNQDGGEHHQNVDTVNEDDDNDDDITDEMIYEFDMILEDIPNDRKKEYLEALEIAPDVVEKESDPVRFLRAEDYDAALAVLRLLEYWQMRVEVFGQEMAYKPMTLRGAMNADIDTMTNIPNWFRILPNDDKGRTVICTDRTNIRYSDYDQTLLMKQLWFIMHLALERKSTQMNGIVLIAIDLTSGWDMLKFRTIQVGVRSLSECLPVKFCCLHICYSSFVYKIVLPIGKYFMTRFMRRRIQVHTNKEIPIMSNELQTYGLHRNNLPTSIGGYYTEEPSWVLQCELLREQLLRRQTKRLRIDNE